MGSLIEELKRREAAARAEEQVSRLVIAREEVMRVLEEPPGTELPGGQAGEPGGKPGPGSPICRHGRKEPGPRK
jgi:hypothetical protein